MGCLMWIEGFFFFFFFFEVFLTKLTAPNLNGAPHLAWTSFHSSTSEMWSGLRGNLPYKCGAKKTPQNKLQRTVHNPSDEFCNVWPTVYREIGGGDYGDLGVFGMKRNIYLSFFLMEIVFVIVLVRVARASHVLSLE